MIYLVTKELRLFESLEYTIISVEQSLELLNKLTIIGLDTETSSLSPHLGKLLTLQLGCKEFQIVIDCTTIDVQLYKLLLTDSSKLFIGHNLCFDLQWLYKENILLTNVYDTFLAEKVIWLGYPYMKHPTYKVGNKRKYVIPRTGDWNKDIYGLSLADIESIYLGKKMDKSVRGEIIWRGLDEKVVIYAAGDVEDLELLVNCQAKAINKWHLFRAIKIENEFVLVQAYIEFCGVKLDVEAWQKKMLRDRDKLHSAEEELNTWIIDWVFLDKRGNKTNEVQSSKAKFVTVDLQGDLWTGFNIKPICAINWRSDQQTIQLFEQLGYNLNTIDKDTKQPKKSAGAKILAFQKGISTILPIYLRFKAAEKLCSTYGQNWIDSINPKTGRIYTKFFPLLDTARLSCGGGVDKAMTQFLGKQVKYCNVQTLPKEDITRACFIAEDGNDWISADYKGQESCLIAHISNDKAMIEEFTTGSKDMHSLVAKMVFKDELKDCSVRDIAKLFPKERNIAKGYEFLFNYGGSAFTIMHNFGLTKERSLEIEHNYMTGFSGLKEYQDTSRKDVLDKGYILLSPITGYIAHVHDFPKIKEYMNMTEEQKQLYYYLKKEDPANPFVEECDFYKERMSSIQKQSINYRIQHLGAATFKLASIYLFKWIVKSGNFNIIKYTIPCHDEINIEAPKNISKIATDKLIECMVEAGKIFCTKVQLLADVNVGSHWIH